MGERSGTRVADRIVGLRQAAEEPGGVPATARRADQRHTGTERSGLGLLLYPAHRRGAGAERRLLLRPHAEIRYETDPCHFQP